MPFLKFEERNGVFGKTALFSLKIFSNREKEVIVLIYQRYQRSSLLCIFHICLKTGKIVSFRKQIFPLSNPTIFSYRYEIRYYRIEFYNTYVQISIMEFN